jgi:fucose permease
MVEGRGMAAASAATLVSLFWGGLTAGRLVAAAAGGRLPPRLLLPLCLAAVLTGVLLLWADLGLMSSALGVALAGLACGPVFPTLIATTPARVGATHAANAVGFQVGAAAAGIAALPAAVGAIAAAEGVTWIAPIFVVLALLLAAGYAWLQATHPA